ncbi:1598_t:CDS:2, partial [Funneliformis caledonium]
LQRFNEKMKSPTLERYGTNHSSDETPVLDIKRFRAASLQGGYATDWVPYENVQKNVEKTERELGLYSLYNLLEAIFTFPDEYRCKQ